MSDHILIIEDVARIIGIQPDTVRRWCRSGFIPMTKLGKRYVIHQSDFTAWIDSKRVPRLTTA